jgi:hypothetical protein
MSAASAGRSSTPPRARLPACRPAWSNAQSSRRRSTGPGPWCGELARSVPRSSPSSARSATASETSASAARGRGCPPGTRTGSRTLAWAGRLCLPCCRPPAVPIGGDARLSQSAR